MTSPDCVAPVGKVPLVSARLFRLAVLLAAALTGTGCGSETPSETAAVPTKLSFTVQPPTSVWAGAEMVPAVRATVLDSRGNTVSDFSGTVEIAITSGTGAPGATLGGTRAHAAVDGIATFDNLVIFKAAAGYTLTAQAGNLESATSASFTVEPGAASALVLTTQPGSVSAGSPITFQVGVQDAYGNTVTRPSGAISVAIMPGTGMPGAVLNGTVTRTPVDGIATFDDLNITQAGANYRLTLTAPDIGSVTTDAFGVNPRAPSRLSLPDLPATATTGYRIVPIQATVLDDLGNIVSDSDATVSMAITDGTGTAGAGLSGTLTRPAVAGVATFDDLSIDQPGTGYTLTAESTGLPDATTGPFAVTEWSTAPTLISLESEAGDFIGQGGEYQYTRADALISGTATNGLFSLSIDGDERWNGYFRGPQSIVRLTPGLYDGLTRYPFNDPETGGLSWSGEGRGCNTLEGWFAIDAVAFDANEFVGVDLRFEQHCEGGIPALRGTIHWSSDDPTTPPGPVYPIPADLWAPAAGSTPATGNYIYLESDAGDYIGGGQTYTYTAETPGITLTDQGGLLAVRVDDWWGEFQAMYTLTRLEQGYYGDLRRYPVHNPTKGGLSWSGQGRGCNKLTGWFAIDTITYQNGELTAMDLRFEQHCEGGTPALNGAIHWVW